MNSKFFIIIVILNILLSMAFTSFIIWAIWKFVIHFAG